MRLLFLSLLLLFLVPGSLAQGLPELGEASASLMTPAMERRVGEQAIREFRLRDPNFLDDPELSAYLNGLGSRLVAAYPEARQDFEFFALRDATLNAFAMPGGYVGVHTGLLLGAQTESELASVLAHEIAHVGQRHFVRMLGRQEQLSVVGVAAMLVALIAARGRADVAQAAMATAAGTSLQAQLDYSRDFEREADRIGFQILQKAGFDVQAVAAFFERLQKFGRIYDNNAPAYLRTHPVTSERIADMQNRAREAPYRQVADSAEFHLVRARLRAEQGTAQEAVAYFEAALNERRFVSEAAARYGYASALARAQQFARAAGQIEALDALLPGHPMLALLAARIRAGSGDLAGARARIEAALVNHAASAPLRYARIEYLQRAGAHREAIDALADLIALHPRDLRLWEMQAKSYAALGRRLKQHQALAEVYVLQGSLSAAIEQLLLAQRSGDGDFYQMSSVDARLRELRRMQSEDAPRR